MKGFFSEKRSRCRVAIGRSDAIIGKISFFNDGSTDGSILCVRGEEECELSQLLLSPPAAVVILGGEQSRSIGLFCSIGVPCIILDEDEEIGNDYKNRVALIDTERQIIIFDPSIETLNFYSNNFKSEKELSRLGCDLGAIIEELPEVEFSSEIKKNERFLIDPRLFCEREDFFDFALSFWESLSPELVIFELSLGEGESEEKLFSETVEDLFMASLYGGFAVSVCNASCESDILRAQRAMHKAFCLLEAEGREFNGYIPRGITVSAPIRLMSELPVSSFDFVILDIDRLLPSLFCLSAEEIIKKEKALKKELLEELKRELTENKKD